MWKFKEGKIVVNGWSFKPDFISNMNSERDYIEQDDYQCFRINKHSFAIWEKKTPRWWTLWITGTRLSV